MRRPLAALDDVKGITATIKFQANGDLDPSGQVVNLFEHKVRRDPPNRGQHPEPEVSKLAPGWGASVCLLAPPVCLPAASVVLMHCTSEPSTL